MTNRRLKAVLAMVFAAGPAVGVYVSTADMSSLIPSAHAATTAEAARKTSYPNTEELGGDEMRVFSLVFSFSGMRLVSLGPAKTSPGPAPNPLGKHDPSDAMSTTGFAGISQVTVDPRGSVDPVRRSMNFADALPKLRVAHSTLARAGKPFEPHPFPRHATRYRVIIDPSLNVLLGEIPDDPLRVKSNRVGRLKVRL
jgi:hypothetical protein